MSADLTIDSVTVSSSVVILAGLVSHLVSPLLHRLDVSLHDGRLGNLSHWGGHEGPGLRQAEAVGNLWGRSHRGHGGTDRDGVVLWEDGRGGYRDTVGGVGVGHGAIQENLGLGGGRGESKNNLGQSKG